MIPEWLREVHLYSGAGMGHKVINCQLPDGLEPEEIIEEMSHVTYMAHYCETW